MSKSMARRRAIQKPDETPSQIVAAYIRFDEYQQHLHSWHTLQDCLERLRLWEAENAAKMKLLARLAKCQDEPQFFTPIEAAAAIELRDRVLKAE